MGINGCASKEILTVVALLMQSDRWHKDEVVIPGNWIRRAATESSGCLDLNVDCALELFGARVKRKKRMNEDDLFGMLAVRMEGY